MIIESISLAIINCSTPSNQPNGVVTVSGTLLGSIAQYNCNDGYVLVGDATRTCENTGHWSGTEPVCNRKYSQLLQSFCFAH